MFPSGPPDLGERRDRLAARSEAGKALYDKAKQIYESSESETLVQQMEMEKHPNAPSSTARSP